MNNQAAQTMPELPKSDQWGFEQQSWLYTDDQMHQYARDYAAALAQTAGVAEGIEELRDFAQRALELAERLVMSGPKAAHVSASETHEIADFVRDTVAMLSAAPAASGGEDKGDPVCHEDDGCPTEGAVLKRFWRSLNTDDTKQLMAFYGVANVAALIEQQVQHVKSLQIKLKAHEPKRDQFPKSPREG